MTKDEALKLALEALESKYIVNCGAWRVQQDKAITAIKEALAQPEHDYKDLYEKEKRRSAMWLSKYEEVAGPAPKAIPMAQPEQKPVAWMTEDECEVYTSKQVDGCFQHDHIPLYTTPPQRTWVGLTEKDICEAAIKSQEGISPRDDTLRFAIAIEAKLKEKNGASS